MPPLEFVQLAKAEVVQEVIGHFNISFNDNNIALLGSTGTLTLLELICDSDSINAFPYRYSYINIPTDRPCAAKISNFDLQTIYERNTVQESQQLALDPMYISECSIEPPKPRAVQVAWAPQQVNSSQRIMAILTSYGACQLYSRPHQSRYWNRKLCCLDSYLQNHIFNTEKPNNRNPYKFQEFKKYIDLYWITAIAWDPAAERQLIYIANAAGNIIALKLNASFSAPSKYCMLNTTLGRITYMKCFDNFLLCGNLNGVVKLFRIEHSAREPSITEVECLWSKADRMTCRQAEVTFVQHLKAYLIVFTKAAHVLAYCVSKEDGTLKCSSTLYVSGIKITGLATFSAQEFFITTITGVVRLLRVSVSKENDLKIDEHIVSTTLDVENMQIMGMATSVHSAILSFVLYRNKEYLHQSRFSNTTTFLHVGLLNIIDPLALLKNENIDVMNKFIDYAVACRMEILNTVDMEKYDTFHDLQSAGLPKILTDAFLQTLQLKLMLLQATAKYQVLKWNYIKETTSNELEFLNRLLKITYATLRLQYLGKQDMSQLTSFQKLAAHCFQMTSQMMINELKTCISAESPLKGVIEGFIALAAVPQNFRYEQYNEICLHCAAPLDATTLTCPEKHPVQRCTVSFVQLPLFGKYFCSQCGAGTLDDQSELQTLFPPEATIKCGLCRFLCTNDEI